MEIYVQEAWAVQFLPHLPAKVKSKFLQGVALFPWALQLALRWRRAAIPDSAWPVLFEKAARDFELKSLGGNEWVMEKPLTRHCVPTSIACEKKPARAEE